MLLRGFKYSYLLLVAHLFSVYCNAQTLGAPIINVTFGEGDADPNTVGPPLSTGNTDFTYTTDLCPPPGHYTVMRTINVSGCFNNSWIPLSSDNTPNPDNYGFMMIVNDTTRFTPKILFVDTVKSSLCVGTQYFFSAALINIDFPSNCSPRPDFPRFIFNIETTSGEVIKTDTTGDITYANGTFGYKMGEYGFPFIMPAGLNTLVIKIKVGRSYYYNNCGDDFAIDDIQFRPFGPDVNITFAGATIDTKVVSVCFQDNKTVSMTGGASGNSAIQWQQSIDNGTTWTDVPGATGNLYSRIFSTPDTFLFRLRASIPSLIANPNCSSVSNVIKVEVDGLPTKFNATNNSPLCAGQNLVFNAEGGASFIWTGPNGFSETSPFPHIFYSTLADSGLYYVQIITVGGCRVTDSTHVTMIGVDVVVGPDQLICKGTTTQLYASGGTSYSWSPSNSLSNANLANPKATPDVTTTYKVIVSDDFGCSNTGSVVVKLLNSVALKAAFTSTEYICRPTDTASFQDMSQGKIVSWNWDFGNGQTSSLRNPPTQQYFMNNSTEGFPVRLTVTDTSGCTDSIFHVTKVANNCFIAVPTAFTPNGDGLNDYLYPLNAYKATNLLFRVYNRYGRLIFETRDWTRKWDGNFRGVQQSSGVFIWTLDYIDASKKKVSLKGTTALIR